MLPIQPNQHTQHIPTRADIGQNLTLCGSVYKIRRMSGFAFVLLQTERELLQCVWAPEFTADITREDIEHLRTESAVRITGHIVGDERARGGFEIRLLSLTVLSEPPEESPIVINGRCPPPLEVSLAHRPIALRCEPSRAVFSVMAALSEGCASFFSQNRFTQIHTPKICAGTAESGAGVFSVDYFGREAFLATSPQLYKQMMVGVFGRVYEIGPVFRAEPHDTARHLNEYTGIDCEVGYVTRVEELMEIECAMLAHAFAYTKDHAASALARLSVDIPDTVDIPSVTFAKAKELLSSRGLHNVDPDLSPAEEKRLCQIAKERWNSEFLFVTAYPTVKRPFYALENTEHPEVTESFDLLFRGMEITTGGLRIHDHGQQMAKMERRGIPTAPFTDYLSAHLHGLPPHGGFGIGLERLTACLCGFDNVRHASLFPRDVSRLTP